MLDFLEAAAKAVVVMVGAAFVIGFIMFFGLLLWTGIEILWSLLHDL